MNRLGELWRERGVLGKTAISAAVGAVVVAPIVLARSARGYRSKKRVRKEIG